MLAYLGFGAIWTGLGLLLTGPLAGTWVGSADRDVAVWLTERRTPQLDEWTNVGSMLADTRVKVVVTTVILVGMVIAWRSWREPFLVGSALILEAAVFITVTWFVGRPRPDVPALDEVSVGTSFPSGHVAAAVAYGAVVIVIFERTRNTWARIPAVVLAAAVPLIVGASRMYRGDHYLTDVIGGILLGGACVVAVYLIAPGRPRRHRWAGWRSTRVTRPEPDVR